MANNIPLSWRLKKSFWTAWQTVRYWLARPQNIGPPRPTGDRITAVRMGQVYRDIPMQNVLVFDRLPEEKSARGMRALVAIGLFLNRLVSPMQAGLPEIDEDVHQALEFGLTSGYRKAFRAPIRPEIFDGPGEPALEDLAVMSPYSIFLGRGADGSLQWDFRDLGDFDHHLGLRSLGLRVLFAESPYTGRLSATEIDSVEYGRVGRGDDAWNDSKTLAICAATTHLSLTRHFNYVHLISGDHWEVAARNWLPSEHPVYRLLWPHLFNSLYTNYGITRVQLLPDGDFVNMFSFTHEGLMTYYDTMYPVYDVAVTDPEADWKRRGLADTEFECPLQENLVDVFRVMLAHTNRYLEAYYPSDRALQEDRAVLAWLAELDRLIPNGVNGALAGELTRGGLARIVAAYIYEGNTIHDMAGTTLWDYQLWPDRNPTRVYRDGRRVPVDVFQRVINNNFALQIRRAPMLADYGSVALDQKGAVLFTQFYEECLALQQRYDETTAGPWRMEPKNLEISMNG